MMDPNAQGMAQAYYYSSGDEAGLGVDEYSGVGYSQVPQAHPYAMQNASKFRIYSHLNYRRPSGVRRCGLVPSMPLLSSICWT